jgi:hypothetical protein
MGFQLSLMTTPSGEVLSIRLARHAILICSSSSRVEGRGAATIHDVTVSNISHPPTPRTSPALEALLHKKDRKVKALERCKKSLVSLESYLSTLNVQYIAMSELRSVMADYDKAAEELDIRGLELKKELKDVEHEIEMARGRLTEGTFNDKLNRRAAIGLFATSEGDVEIVLIYGAFGGLDPCTLSNVKSKLSGVHLGTLDTTCALICKPKRSQ